MNRFSRKEGKGDDLKLRKSVGRKSPWTQTTITSWATTTDQQPAKQHGLAVSHGTVWPCCVARCPASCCSGRYSVRVL